MIKAILFDVDGVLIDSFDANLVFYQNLLSKAGYPPPTAAQFWKIFHASMADCIKRFTKQSSDAEVQRIWEMGNKRIVAYPNHLLKLQKGVKEVVQKLYKKYPLGIVTSRVRNGVFEFSDLSALQQYFSTTVAYEDTKNHKPDPEPLLLAAKNLLIKPSEAVYIGDLENDVQAAKAAGMKVIIYSTQQFPSAHNFTSSFNEIPALIESLH